MSTEKPKKAEIAGGLALAPGIGAAILANVACPLCYPAIAGVFSSLGLGFLFDDKPLLIITAIFISISLFGLGYRARKRHGYGPFILGVFSVALGILGKVGKVQANLLFTVGVTGLIVASVWNLIPKRSCENCKSVQEA